jgi:hypothetical protein
MAPGEADALMLAHAFAKRHSLLVNRVTERDRSGQYVAAYEVYRKVAGRRVYMGRRRFPDQLLRFLEKLVPAEAQAHG